MMNLEKLMDLPGAMAAFTYSDRGELQSHSIREGNEITPQVLDLLSRSCVANQAIARMEASGWEAVTGQGGFQPLQGFSVVGLEWSVVVNGNCGVIARNRDVDYEATFSALTAG
jgi:roadblock/LC7 domain-containing protein